MKPTNPCALALALSLGLACNRNEAPPSVGGERIQPERASVASNRDVELTPAARLVSGPDAEGAPKQAKNSEAPPERTPDVVFVPTPQPVVDKMLELAQPKKTDVVYDLGCGDGRIVITAAKRYGTRAYGFDIDPARVAEAKENVQRNGVGDLVTIEQRDIFELDLSPADIVTLYLLPDLNVKLIPQLEKLRPGSRIISHDFDMRGVTPSKHIRFTPDGTSRTHEIFLFDVPLKKETSTTAAERR